MKTKTFEVYDTEEDALSARDPEDTDSVDIDLKSTTSSDVGITDSDTLTQVGMTYSRDVGVTDSDTLTCTQVDMTGSNAMSEIEHFLE